MTTKKKELSKKKTTGSSPRKKVDQTEYWSKQDDYKLEATHPHRQLIIDQLKQLEPFAGVLEVGCDIGQNLYLVGQQYPETQLAGVDVNARAIESAQLIVSGAILKVGNAEELPFEDKSFDIVIYDAILMYVKDIDKALSEARRVARKTIIILDWQAGKETLIGHSLARDYEGMFSMETGTLMINITKEIWPTSEKWQKYGRLFVVPVPSPTSTIS